MAVRRPTLDQLRSVAEDLGMHMGDEELKSYDALMQANYAAYDAVDAMPDYVPAVKYPRTPGYRPEGEENKYNAWYVKTEVKGAPSGKLAGKKIVLKDNVCLAGVPMMNGASTLEGYMPDIDATIVTRILDAGGTIVGKAHCEYFCFSGGSHTCAAGAGPQSAQDGLFRRRLVVGQRGRWSATGEVDMAIGGDQGGSIRIPASFSGIYGMKATHGLVPYTGVMPIEVTIDHTGPMTRNVARQRAAAGSAGRRRRPRSAPEVRRRSRTTPKRSAAASRACASASSRKASAMPSSEPDVDAKVKAGASASAKLGATVEEVSIPMHLRRRRHLDCRSRSKAPPSSDDERQRHGHQLAGLYKTTPARRPFRLASPRRRTVRQPQDHDAARCNTSPSTIAAISTPRRRTSNRKLRAAYDAVLGNYDLLLMPTLPMKATPLPPPDAPRELYIQRAFEMVPNTAPFDVTRPSVDEPSLRHERRPADRHDADRQVFRRADHLSRRRRLRRRRRLDQDVIRPGGLPTKARPPHQPWRRRWISD